MEKNFTKNSITKVTICHFCKRPLDWKGFPVKEEDIKRIAAASRFGETEIVETVSQNCCVDEFFKTKRTSTET